MNPDNIFSTKEVFINYVQSHKQKLSVVYKKIQQKLHTVKEEQVVSFKETKIVFLKFMKKLTRKIREQRETKKRSAPCVYI